MSDGPGQPHAPVMVARVVELLAVPHGDGVIVDATIGAAGHAAALLAASSEQIHLVGFDRDADALALARRRLTAYAERVHLVHAGYEDLAEHVGPVVAHAGALRAVLYDLGVSSMQLDRPERGFSFRSEGPLDMRMDATQATTAADLVNDRQPDELAGLLRTFGEERYAGRIAHAIVRARPLSTTTQLAEVIAASVPAAARHGRIHPATRSFQALRIAVNGELERFSASLPQALELLAPAPRPTDGARGGRVAVLSYHSLEDRIAKGILADAAAGCICPPDLPVCGCGRVPSVRLVTRGAEGAAQTELDRNPRARTARLRAAERVAVPPDPSNPRPERRPGVAGDH